MEFYDKNGALLHVGDHIIPDQGRELLLVSSGEVEAMGLCMFGQQVDDLLAFSVLTQENLSSQWTKKEA